MRHQNKANHYHHSQDNRLDKFFFCVTEWNHPDIHHTLIFFHRLVTKKAMKWINTDKLVEAPPGLASCLCTILHQRWLEFPFHDVGQRGRASEPKFDLGHCYVRSVLAVFFVTFQSCFFHSHSFTSSHNCHQRKSAVEVYAPAKIEMGPRLQDII